MSTRHVWEKFNIAKSFVQTSTKYSNLKSTYVDIFPISGPDAVLLLAYNTEANITINQQLGTYSFTATQTRDCSGSYSVYQRVGTSQKYGVGFCPEQPSYYILNQGSTAIKVQYNEDTGMAQMGRNSTSSGNTAAAILYHLEEQQECGTTSQGKSASTSESKYPDDAISGSYWYVYQGSDCIDPTAVSIPSEVKAGDTITAALTARANTYGGTITYTYSYSVDGGSTWVSAGSTTATSLAITVPEDAEQFQVRVVAKDNYGFTSTTYVKSANVEVRRGAALLACIDGVLREITPTVMVDGVLRQLTEVPAMIDGVNRELGAG